MKEFLKFIGFMLISAFVFLGTCFGFTILLFRGANIILWIIGASVVITLIAALVWWSDLHDS